jgi:hypothetical protein
MQKLMIALLVSLSALLLAAAGMRVISGSIVQGYALSSPSSPSGTAWKPTWNQKLKVNS